jgi:CAAX protease family protein
VTTDADRRRRARRGLAVYFGIVVVLSGVIQTMILRTGTTVGEQPLLIFLLMWSPAFASLVARLALREHPRDVSFGIGGKRGLRALGFAWATPLLIGTVAYGLAWGSGLERFTVPPTVHVAAPVAFGERLAFVGSVGLLPSLLLATGEELGWRGYMLTRLVDAGVPRPVLTSGLVWAIWHVPMILSGQYAVGRYPLLSALLFIPGVVAGGIIVARLRLASGSIWPAALFHAQWNVVIQGAFDRYTSGGSANRGSTLWTGESGILVVLTSIVFALILARDGFPIRRTTREEPTSTLALRDA